MIIIGIDPGTAQTGWGVIQADGNGAIKLVAHGCIKTKPSQSKADRLHAIASQVAYLIKEHKPDHLAIEKLFFNINVKSAIAVSEAMGAILAISGSTNTPTFEYSPLKIKRVLTGYGRATKRQLQSATRKILRIRRLPRPTHAADALAVAICHFKVLNGQQ